MKKQNGSLDAWQQQKATTSISSRRPYGVCAFVDAEVVDSPLEIKKMIVRGIEIADGDIRRRCQCVFNWLIAFDGAYLVWRLGCHAVLVPHL